MDNVLNLIVSGGIIALLLDIRHKLGEYGIRLTHLEKRTDKLEETHVKNTKRPAFAR